MPIWLTIVRGIRWILLLILVVIAAIGVASSPELTVFAVSGEQHMRSA